MVFKLDRICVWTFIICFALISTFNLLGFLDEIVCLVFTCLAFADCVINPNQIKRYYPLLLFITILSLYAIYSIIIGSNEVSFILLDFIIQIKPFMVFFVVYAIAPLITPFEKRVIRVICLINIAFMTILMLMGEDVIRNFIYHITYCGNIIFLSSIIFIFCSLDSEWNLSRIDKAIIFMSLVVGLYCMRSKYYAEFIFLLFMICFYKPGMMRKFSLKYLLLVIVLIGVIVLATWKKISYYYLTGLSDITNPSMAYSFARPALYWGAGMVLLDYLPFGSGLATYATYASMVGYSKVYFEYGLNNVWGLSPGMSNFICDAFYAELAQFGLVGVFLFIYFWVWVYKRFKQLTKKEEYKYVFIVGTSAMIFIFVECTSGSAFIQAPGVMAMLVIGLITAVVQNAPELATSKNKNIKIRYE